MMRKVGIVAAGSYVPAEKLTNRDLEKMVETTDEWITSRTGIKERRIAPAGVHASDLAVKAAADCLARTPDRPQLLISATSSAEKACPYQASIIAQKLHLTNLAAFDLNAACSGLVYALAVGRSLMQTEGYDHALITAGEKLSRFVDYKDRASCILFGDAGAAFMLSAEEQPEHELLTVELGADPTGADLVIMGGPDDEFYFRQDGKGVFRFAVEKMSSLIDLLKARVGCDDDRYFIIPHQANSRILEAVARNKEIPTERFVSNISKYGNTSSASIGLALKEAWDENRFTKGDYLFLIGFGGGLSWAAAAIRW